MDTLDVHDTLFALARRMGGAITEPSFHEGYFLHIDYLPLPPSDNEKVHHWRKAYEKLKTYKEDVQAILLTKRVPIPTAPAFLLYKCYLNRKSRDAQNCQKALLDALYKNDNQVYPMTLPPEVDKANPRVECWIVKI